LAAKHLKAVTCRVAGGGVDCYFLHKVAGIGVQVGDEWLIPGSLPLFSPESGLKMACSHSFPYFSHKYRWTLC